MQVHSQPTFVDLFAGIGGLRLAAENVGARCVFTSEWDEYARTLYEANFRDNREIAGDIREIDEATIPPHDLLWRVFHASLSASQAFQKQMPWGASMVLNTKRKEIFSMMLRAFWPIIGQRRFYWKT